MEIQRRLTQFSKWACAALLFTASLAQAADSPIVGTWTAKAHDLPAIRMVVGQDKAGKLNGIIIFYFLQKQHGAWKVKGNSPTEMIHPRLEGKTFLFEVPHAKKHGSTDPKDQEIKTFRLELTAPNEAVFRNADNGQDLRLRRIGR